MYDEDEFLALSGIQHFAFCRRQWALIHLEQAWADNVLTAEGDLMHRRAHDDELRERRGDILVVRGLAVHSRALGLAGTCDVVEFHKDESGHPLAGEDGLWRPVPVEYKRGHSKAGDADRLQLAAQALCLEEMLGCDVLAGFLFYGETKVRERVEFGARAACGGGVDGRRDACVVSAQAHAEGEAVSRLPLVLACRPVPSTGGQPDVGRRLPGGPVVGRG